MYTRIRKSLDQKDKGFTLIELLVVIIIIGILAAIAIPIFLNQRKKAVDASMKSDARTVATQLETFYTDAQSYPTVAEFVLNATTPVTIDIGTEDVVLSPGNTVTVQLNEPTVPAATAFCVIVTNPKGTGAKAWQSNAGGLLTTATCDAAEFGVGDLLL